MADHVVFGGGIIGLPTAYEFVVRASRQVHVLNAPSPAATSSLEIAKHIVAQLSDWSS